MKYTVYSSNLMEHPPFVDAFPIGRRRFPAFRMLQYWSCMLKKKKRQDEYGLATLLGFACSKRLEKTIIPPKLAEKNFGFAWPRRLEKVNQTYSPKWW